MEHKVTKAYFKESWNCMPVDEITLRITTFVKTIRLCITLCYRRHKDPLILLRLKPHVGGGCKGSCKGRIYDYVLDMCWIYVHPRMFRDACLVAGFLACTFVKSAFTETPCVKAFKVNDSSYGCGCCCSSFDRSNHFSTLRFTQSFIQRRHNCL